MDTDNSFSRREYGEEKEANLLYLPNEDVIVVDPSGEELFFVKKLVKSIRH
ncbi:hypothetical protein [Priestia aryabhattai]|uniref:hypothetical protein n=1 Tax=Priestia aryabhattai TaxID=412384 RepID=UPI002E231371|nr:hypothetical protein [Priestia aryabhattai]